jgi:hypothetical protein
VCCGLYRPSRGQAKAPASTLHAANRVVPPRRPQRATPAPLPAVRSLHPSQRSPGGFVPFEMFRRPIFRPSKRVDRPPAWEYFRTSWRPTVIHRESGLEQQMTRIRQETTSQISAVPTSPLNRLVGSCATGFPDLPTCSPAIRRAWRSSGRWSRYLSMATSTAKAGAYRWPRTLGRAVRRGGPGAVSTHPLHAQRDFFRWCLTSRTTARRRAR